MIKIVQKPHVIFEWIFSPNKKIYLVYIRYTHKNNNNIYAPFPVLIGVTKDIESDTVFPMNHPRYYEMTKKGNFHHHFAYDEGSMEDYLNDPREILFPMHPESITETLEFLKQHAPKSASAKGYGEAKEGYCHV